MGNEVQAQYMWPVKTMPKQECPAQGRQAYQETRSIQASGFGYSRVTFHYLPCPHPAVVIGFFLDPSSQLCPFQTLTSLGLPVTLQTQLLFQPVNILGPCLLLALLLYMSSNPSGLCPTPGSSFLRTMPPSHPGWLQVAS